VKRGILIFTGLVVFLAGGALVAPNLVDWNKYKPQIIAQVENATGYKLAIAGDLDMAVLPFPRVMIDGLTVTVPGVDEALLSLKTAAVNVELLPLLQKQVKFTRVELIEPKVRLSIDAQGNPGWMTPTLQEKLNAGKGAAPAADAGLAVSLSGVRIKDGDFTFTDRRAGKPVSLTDIDMDIGADSLSGPFAATGGARYGNAAMKIELKSARIDSAVGNAPLQASVTFPEAASSLSYAGVAGMKDGKPDLQGETTFKSANLSQLMIALGAKENKALAKAVEAQGLVTIAGDSFAARNLRVNIGGQEMTGSIETANFRQKPMSISTVLAAEKPFDLSAVLPPAVAAKDKKPVKNFLSESLVMATDINGSADLKFTELKWNGVTVKNAVMNARKQDGKINLTGGGEAFGGKASKEAELTFGSATKTAAGGATYTDPSMKFKATVQNFDIEDSLKPFLKPEQMKGLTPVLADALTGNFEGTVTKDKITLTPAAAKIGKETITYNASYTLAARPVLEVGIGAESFDAGRWLKPPQQAGQEAVATAAAQEAAAAKKAQVAEMAKKLALPVDLRLTLALKNVTMQGAKYDDVFFVGKLTGAKLDIEKAGLSDAAQNNIALTGSVGNVGELKDIDLTISGATPDAEKMLASFNVDTKKLPKNIGRAELASEFKGQANNLAFVVNLKAMQGALETSGSLIKLLETPQVDGMTVRLRHPSYVDVMRIFNPNFSSGVAMRKSLDLFASMERAGTAYKFTDLQATLGDVKATGTLNVEMAGVRPSVNGALQFDKLPLDELLGVQAGAKGTVRANTTAPSGAADVRWSRNAINTAWMWKFNLDMTATAASVTYGEWTVGNADFAVNLKDGALSVTRLNGDVGGGTMALTANMKSSDKERQPVTAAATADFKNVELEQIVRGFAGSRLVKAKGPVSMDLAVSTSGISPAALIFDLKGTGKAQGANMVFDGFDLARMSRTLAAPSSSGTENITNLLNATMKGGSTAFDNFYTDILIAEGVVTFPKFRLEGKDAAITLDGSVNLPLWTVDLVSNIHLTEPVGSPPLRVVFKGPLDNPGQTFGQSAMENYLRGIVGDKVQGAITDKLKDKLGDGGIEGALGDVLGLGGKQPKAPAVPNAVPAPVAPAAPTAPGVAEPQAAAPAPAATVAPAPVAPVEAVPVPAPVEAVTPAPVEAAPVAAEPAPVAPAAEAAPAQAAPAQQEQPAPESSVTGDPAMDQLLENVIEGVTTP
jgi:uncharacterized protein involved in outer membrane biogenesis